MIYPNTTPVHLTPTERDVLGCVAKGMSSRMIAIELDVSKRTVDFHLDRVYRKLGVHNRMQAVNVAHSDNLL